MTDNKDKTAAGRTVKSITQLAAEMRSEAVRNAKTALSAKSSSAGSDQARLKVYLINYRISGKESALLGDGAERRAAITEILDSLRTHDKHLSTSTWIIESTISAAQIVKAFVPLLDAKHDFLSASEVTQDRASFGNAQLQP